MPAPPADVSAGDRALTNDPRTVWYFAYGSNMQRDTFERRRGLAPVERAVGVLPSYRLTFDLPVGPGQRGVANLLAAPAARTYGVLYRIAREQVDRLDRSEGVPLAYRKLWTEVTATTAAGGNGHGACASVCAFTYISPHRDPARKPSARYLRLLVEGANEHGLPSDYIAELQALELALDERASG